MNFSDSERIKTILKSTGHESASEKEADLIIVNACSVRQSAVDRIYGKLKQWQGKKIFITGCVLPKDRQKLAPKVDLIFDIKDLSKLPKWLGKQEIKVKNYFKIPPTPQLSTLIPIMTGCEHFCSYCAVPYVRGQEYSRPEKEIIGEVKNLVKREVKEITLLGQNVNRYRPSFVQLLEKLVKIPGDFKVKFISPNPWDFPKKLIDLIAKEPKLAKEIHLPVQSGDDQILKKMNRPYTAKQYLDLVNHLRSAISNLRLSTDLIVGFPGETKKALQNTVKLCKKAHFDKAYIAQYSPRPGTAAAELKDDVPKEEKKRRWKKIDKLING